MRGKIAPSLLQMFRLFLWIRILFTLWNIVLFSSWFGSRMVVTSFFTLSLSVLLLLYLYSAHLQRWLKHRYLPIALITVTTLIVLEARIFYWIIYNTDFVTRLPLTLATSVAKLLNSPAFPILLAFSNPSALFVPLVFMSWQYNFRSVMIFIVLTTGLELALLVPIRDIVAQELSLEVFTLFTRNGAFGIVGYIVSQLASVQRKQHAELETSHQQLALYMTTQEKLLVSQERNRLARELHDTLAHTMSAVTVKLNAANLIWERDPARAKTMIEQIITSMNDGNVEIRRALRDLRATPLDDMGLVLAVRHLAEAAAPRGNLLLDLDTPNHDLQFAPEIELGIYRIAQEALTNTVEHANARCVRLSMKQQANRFTLEIEDDGTGFVPEFAERSGRLGLMGMKERARMLGGQLKIESTLHKGSRIEFVLEMV
jgi:signal transduction histidine kinase